MTDTPSLEDRAKQLIADMSHAMDSNAPVSPVMLADLKAVIAEGLKAHADCAAMHAGAQATEAKAAQLEAEAGDLVAAIHGGQ